MAGSGERCFTASRTLVLILSACQVAEGAFIAAAGWMAYYAPCVAGVWLVVTGTFTALHFRNDNSIVRGRLCFRSSMSVVWIIVVGQIAGAIVSVGAVAAFATLIAFPYSNHGAGAGAVLPTGCTGIVISAAAAATSMWLRASLMAVAESAFAEAAVRATRVVAVVSKSGRSRLAGGGGETDAGAHVSGMESVRHSETASICGDFSSRQDTARLVPTRALWTPSTAASKAVTSGADPDADPWDTAPLPQLRTLNALTSLPTVSRWSGAGMGADATAAGITTEPHARCDDATSHPLDHLLFKRSS